MTTIGQYFTPRHVSDHMMKIMKDTHTHNSNITIYEPFCGTSSFINDMYKYIHNKEDIKTNNKVQYFTPKPVVEVDHIKKRILINTNTPHYDPYTGTGGFIIRMYEYMHDKEEEKKDERRIIYVVNKYSRYKNKYMYDNKRTMEKRKIRKIFKK